MDLKKHIRSIPDYPKKGISFRDITTLIKNANAFRYTNDTIIELAKKHNTRFHLFHLSTAKELSLLENKTPLPLM